MFLLAPDSNSASKVFRTLSSDADICKVGLSGLDVGPSGWCKRLRLAQHVCCSASAGFLCEQVHCVVQRGNRIRVTEPDLFHFAQADVVCRSAFNDADRASMRHGDVIEASIGTVLLHLQRRRSHGARRRHVDRAEYAGAQIDDVRIGDRKKVQVPAPRGAKRSPTLSRLCRKWWPAVTATTSIGTVKELKREDFARHVSRRTQRRRRVACSAGESVQRLRQGLRIWLGGDTGGLSQRAAICSAR